MHIYFESLFAPNALCLLHLRSFSQSPRYAQTQCIFNMLALVFTSHTHTRTYSVISSFSSLSLSLFLTHFKCCCSQIIGAQCLICFCIKRVPKVSQHMRHFTLCSFTLHISVYSVYSYQASYALFMHRDFLQWHHYVFAILPKHDSNKLT